MNHTLYLVELITPQGEARELDSIELTHATAELGDRDGRQEAQRRMSFDAALNAYMYAGEIIPAPMFGGLRVTVRARWVVA